MYENVYYFYKYVLYIDALFYKKNIKKVIHKIMCQICQSTSGTLEMKTEKRLFFVYQN